MSTLRVAAVGYLNARPLCEALAGDAGVRAAPRAAERGREAASRRTKRDVALMPVAAAATIGDLRVARGWRSASRGPVRSVVIVSERPIEELRSSRSTYRRGRASSWRGSSATRAAAARSLGFVACSPQEALALRGQDARGARHRRPCARRTRGASSHVFDLGASVARADRACRSSSPRGSGARARCRRGRAAPRRREARGLARRDALADAACRETGLPRESLRAYLHESDPLRAGRRRARGSRALLRRGGRARTPPRATRPLLRRRSRVASRSPTAVASTRCSRVRPTESASSAAEGERLGAEGSLFDLGLAADAIRKRKHPHGVVTYIVDRNVNYTNVCTTSCRFCAFYRPVGHAEGYVLSREVLGKKLQEVVDAGGVQILLQGGLNPDLRIEWYEDLFRWIKREYRLGLHALSPEEILFIGRLESLTARRVLERLARGGARLGPRRRRGDPRRPRAPQDRQGQVHERRVARRHAHGAPDGPPLERDDDVRHGRHAARPRASPHEASRSAGRDARVHRVLLLGLPARAGDAHRSGRRGDAPVPAAAGARAPHARQRRPRRARRGSRRVPTSGRSRCASARTTSAA